MRVCICGSLFSIFWETYKHETVTATTSDGDKALLNLQTRVFIHFQVPGFDPESFSHKRQTHQDSCL